MMGNIYEALKTHKRKIILLGVMLLVLDGTLFSHIITAAKNGDTTEFDFLNVGQGDSELVQLMSGKQHSRIKILIDGGPENGMGETALAALLSPTDKYIDLVVMTHAQADHMGGLITVMKHYRVGAFLWTGRVNDISAFRELMDILKKNHTKIITLARGDVIKNGENKISVISPDTVLVNDKDLNNSSLVLRVASASTTALFLGDVGKIAEFNLVRSGITRADIIKVPHHGSRASLVPNFLYAIHPRIAVFEVGKNSYGHPTEEALKNYTQLGAKLFRTDKDGTIRLLVGKNRNITVIKN